MVYFCTMLFAPLNKFLFLIIATASSTSFSQEVQIDTSVYENETQIKWRSGESLIEQKDFKDDVLVRHIKRTEGINYFSKGYFDNGTLLWNRTLQRSENEDILNNYSDGLVPVGEHVQYRQNGDTAHFEVYPDNPEIEVFSEYGELYPILRIDFEYYDNDTLNRRTSSSRIIQEHPEFDVLNRLGWQREYYINGKLAFEKFVVIPEGKLQIELANMTEFERTLSILTNSFNDEGQLIDSIRVSKSMIYGRGFYDNGELSYIGESSLKTYIYTEEFEDIKWFSEDGTSEVVNEKGTQKFKGDILIYNEKRDKKGDPILEEYFWDNGKRRAILSKTYTEYFNRKGKFLLKDDYKNEKTESGEKVNAFNTYKYDRHFISSNSIDWIPKMGFGQSVNETGLDSIALPNYNSPDFMTDTLIFYKGELYEHRFYNVDYRTGANKAIKLASIYNYSSCKGINSSPYGSGTFEKHFRDISKDFQEFKRYREGLLEEDRILLDSVQGKYIYESHYYPFERYEYRNYYDSIFIYTRANGISGNVWDPADSVVLSKKYNPSFSDPLIYDNAGSYSYLYTSLEGWGHNEYGDIISHTQVWDEEDRAKNGDHLRFVREYFYDGLLIEKHLQYEDSLVTSLFTLQGVKHFHSVVQTEYGRNSGKLSKSNFLIFDKSNSKGDRVRQVIPYAPTETSNYESIIYTADSTYALIGSAYVIETITNKIIYQAPLNLQFEKASWSHLVQFKSHLYLLTNNSIYDFENDKSYEINKLEKTLKVDSKNAYIYDGEPYIKVASLEAIIEQNRLIILDSIDYRPISDWNEYYLYNEIKLVEFTTNYKHEIKTIDLKTSKSDYVSFDELGISNFQRVGDIFYYYESKENQKVKNGFYIDTITYFDINDSEISIWPLSKRIEYKHGQIITYPQNNGVQKSSSRQIYEIDLENEIIIAFTTFDQYDDFTGCCPDPVNQRDFENIRIDFRNREITYLNKPINYSLFDKDYDPTALEKFLSKVNSTDEIFYSARKKNDIAKFQLKRDQEAIILDLKNGQILSDRQNEVFSENYWKVKTDPSHNLDISDQDKETAMHFLDATYRIDTAEISKLFFSLDLIPSKRKMFYANNKDYLRLFWNGDQMEVNNRLVAISFLDSKPIFYTPDRYYMSAYGAEEYLHFQKGLRTYNFEQFDLKYNRPDIILDRLGYADSALVDAYHAAYQKRLKKMGFTEDMLQDDFHLPEIKIENFEEMPTLQDQGSIDLKLKLEDSKYKLDRINLWVNDVAVYGSNGISLREKDVQDYSTTLSVNLAKGNNKVQVSVLNQAGAESYKETFEIECTAGKTEPNLYLITIGESEFQQADFNLSYAAKDAKDIAALFEKSSAYGEVKTKTLVNEEVTKENVIALKSFLAESDINDEVMIFIAGHGVLDANLDYFFATYDMDFQNPADKGLAYEGLESLLDGIKPLKKTLMIDACHSGEIDKDEVELAVADVNESDDIQFRAVGNSASPKLGMQNTSELTKSLFTDLRKGTGATVISSAGGMEFAMEGDDWSNGLFTYCFINGIKTKAADYDNNGEIWLSEIKKYVSEQVTELSNGKQQPTSRIENQVVDFRVW